MVKGACQRVRVLIVHPVDCMQRGLAAATLFDLASDVVLISQSSATVLYLYCSYSDCCNCSVESAEPDCTTAGSQAV